MLAVQATIWVIFEDLEGFELRVPAGSIAMMRATDKGTKLTVLLSRSSNPETALVRLEVKGSPADVTIKIEAAAKKAHKTMLAEIERPRDRGPFGAPS